MSEHDDRHDHDAKADELERELDDMQEQAGDLGGEIEGAGEQWERRKGDDSVPGATGEPADDEDGEDGEDGTPDDGDELDFGRDFGDAVVAEDGPPSDDDEKDEAGGDEDR
jgi:hypothetical protein